jgi:hypothetical protein
LKADPQMAKLIQNISSANDSEQYKDNNNNITRYLEVNKYRLIDLAEKHYENLVEVLANSNMNNAPGASPSSNSALSLAQSSFTLELYHLHECRDQYL